MVIFCKLLLCEACGLLFAVQRVSAFGFSKVIFEVDSNLVAGAVGIRRNFMSLGHLSMIVAPSWLAVETFWLIYYDIFECGCSLIGWQHLKLVTIIIIIIFFRHYYFDCLSIPTKTTTTTTKHNPTKWGWLHGSSYVIMF